MLSRETTQEEIQGQLASIRKSIESATASIDNFYYDLGLILPDINLEIYKTNNKAAATLDSLRSESTDGKIDLAIEMISNELAAVLQKLHDINSQDSRVMDAVCLLGNLLGRSSSAIEQLALIDRPGEDFKHLLQKLTNVDHELGTLHAELSDPMKKISEMEISLLESLKDHIDDDIQSLNETLGGILYVLKDLVKRTDSAKPPILNIMTSLQIHDIISQDLANIHRGLGESEEASVNLSNPENLKFTESVIIYSSDLINSIIDILTTETEKIRLETNHLLQITTSERDDKVLLSDYLLENREQLSSFDAAISEFCDTLSNIQSRLELLAANKWLIPGHLHELAKKAELMMTLCIDIKQTTSTNTDYLNPVISALNDICSLHEKLDGYSLKDLKAFIEHINEVITNVLLELSDIKTIMLDSIAGVDGYCQRSLNYISQFKKTIDSSRIFIEELYHVEKKIKDFAGADVNSNGIPAALPDANFSSDRMQHTINRLALPHISTINQPEEDLEDGITLF